jgi:hypothetical protein
MLRKQLLALAPALFAVGIIGSGCDKAKKAAEDALGIKKLEAEDQEELLKATKWNETVDQTKWKIHGGVEIADNFKGDLGKEVSFVLPFDLPAQDPKVTAAAGEKKRMLLLLKEEKFTIPGFDQPITRFRIASIAQHDSESNEVKIDGGQVNQYLDESQRLGPGNQSGKYLLAEGVGSGGLAFIQGIARVKKNDGSEAAPLGDVMVFTSSSPFVTLSGKSGVTTGQYMLAMLDGSKGQVTGYKSDVPSTYKGAPASVSAEIAYAGALDQYKGDVDAKLADVSQDAELKAKADASFTKLNNAVTPYLGGWTLINIDLLFVQPPAAAPAPVAQSNPPPTPTPSKPAEPAPPPATEPTPVVVRQDPKDEDPPQVDLGCTGQYLDGETPMPSLFFGGDDIADDTKKGWRASGDVRITAQEHEAIFGSIEAVRDAAGADNRYLDNLEGYCLLTTGDAQYQASDKKATQMQPGPDGAGKTSEMWQKVKVPSKESEVKSIQMRVAFFSQEFPKYVGSKFNDSFYIKFDELPEFLAEGNLNDLAGSADEIAACKSKTFDGTQQKCGQWMSISGDAKLKTGALWDIEKSSQATKSSAFKCGSDNKCYHGYIQPRIICRDLTDDHFGKEFTLRMSVSDAGDSIFDSALAVDSIVFSTESCATGTFTKEDRSAVTP